MKIEGSFLQTIQGVNVPHAVVEFNDMSDFVGSYSILSTVPPSFIGIDTIDLKFEDGSGRSLKVIGTIPGGLDQRYAVTGSGKWH